MFDLSAPGSDPTGKELSLSQLAVPDERNLRYVGHTIEQHQAALNLRDNILSTNIPEDIRSRLATAKQIAIYGWFRWEFYTVSLFWSLTTVEMALKHKLVEHFSHKFRLIKKKGTQQRIVEGGFEAIDDHLRSGWRIDGLPEFNGSFRGLFAWARDQKVLAADTPVVIQQAQGHFENRFLFEIFPERARADGRPLNVNPNLGEIQALWASLSAQEQAKYQFRPIDVLADELPYLRNYLAHPSSFNPTMMTRAAVEGYVQSVEIVGRLWPA